MPRAEAPLPSRDRSARLQTAVGCVLLLVAALGGVYVAIRPGPTSLDRFFTDAVSGRGLGAFHRVPLVRNPVAMAVSTVILSVVEVFRDRVRALAVLVGPLAALSTSEWVVKPLVGRYIGPTLAYPSGTLVATTALATALVLVTPDRWRVAGVVAAALYTGWTCVAVVALDLHYGTDAAAGVAYGAGMVLVVDGVAWILLGHRRPPFLRRRMPAVVPVPGSAALHPVATVVLDRQPVSGSVALAPEGPHRGPSADG